MKRFGWLLVVGILSTPVSAPLFSSPFFASDDGLFHLYRLFALDEALRQGEYYPRLFPSFAFGYGQAVFTYYGPLGYYVAEFFHLLGVGFPDAIKLTFAFGYVASGWTLFLLARQYVEPIPALLGAAIYMGFPYHVAETYQRGALAEHLAFIFLPLLLLPIGKTHSLAFALALAALILTHSLTAMIFLPFAVLYQWLMLGSHCEERHLRRSNPVPRAFARQQAKPAAQGNLLAAMREIASRTALAMTRLRNSIHWLTAPVARGVLLGLGVSACYWMPIVTQSRWVGLSAGLDNQGYLAHLAPLAGFVQPSLIMQYAPAQMVAAEHPLSLASFVVLLIVLAGAVRAWQKGTAFAMPLALFAGLGVGALFMATDLSGFLWRAFHNPLTFLQYPWRFMMLAALGMAMGATLALAERRWFALTLVPLFMLASTASIPLKPLREAVVGEQAMWQYDFKNRQIGSTWTAEYMPWWVWADRTAIPLPPRAPVSDVSLAAPSVRAMRVVKVGYAPATYRVTASPTPQSDTTRLRFHQFYMPQWRITLNGQPLQTYPTTELGLLTVDLPPSKESVLEMSWSSTAFEQGALVVSIISVIVLLVLFRNQWRLFALVSVALVVLLATNQQTNNPTIYPIHAQLEDFADLLAVRLERETYGTGDAVPVTLIWLARRETRENIKVFVHLTDADNARVMAQSDGDPVGGFTPTSRWQVGEIVGDTHVLTVPTNAGTGSLKLFAGMYYFEPLRNLQATRDGIVLPDNRILLGEIRVVSR